TLFPFNYQELSSVNKYKQRVNTAEKAFLFSCLRGEFPELATRRDLNAREWYAGYLQTYLERDVRGLHNIGSLREFQRFLQLLAGRCSQELNLSYFAQELGTAVNTIKNWISVLAASQIIFFLSPYSRNLGKRVVKNPKIYFIDCGLICHLTGIFNREHIISGPMSGPLFENYVISETYKILRAKGESPALYYFRTHKGLEVDLIIEEGLKLYPAEIKLTKTPRREMILPMEKLKAMLGRSAVAKGRLICMAEDGIPFTKDISVQSAVDYFTGI
ncbi:MAG: DUF4143 domain-containing protein, partial [Candidatus Margulisiibacteriota bacterium]